MTLLDTHVWLWWLDDPKRLSEHAMTAIEEARTAGTLAVSSISVWEAAMLVKKGRLALKVDVANLVSSCEQLSFLEFVPISSRIALESVRLEPFHPDPADRFIVATAKSFGGTVVTKDERIRKFKAVKSVW